MDACEALDICEAKDITVGPIVDMREIAQNPHIAERHTLVDRPEPVTGKTLRIPDVPMRISRTPGEFRFPGLPPESANEAVFGDLLGYTEQQLADFKAKKVI
jgi:crotonobetainyl-CoA:carnitine CoA-transferase CaiB-like acyl-CoA transferase